MMQNNRNEKWNKLWKEKGFYMVLTFCLAVIGISGIFLVRGVSLEKQRMEESLTVPVSVPETTEDPEAIKREAQAQVPVEVPHEPPAEPVSVEEDAVLPVGGIVIQDYAMDHLCYNETTQDWRIHNGVDLAAPLGEPVQAAKSGTVTAVYEDEYLGTTVVLEHPEGYTTHYCNLAPEPQAAAGQQVKAGDTLGKVGQTALLELAGEPHLHFEVYRNGDPVNPAEFLYS